MRWVSGTKTKFQHYLNVRAAVVGAKACEVMGLIPAGCWALLSSFRP